MGVNRATRERRKYTLQGYSAGCLQDYQLIASQMRSQKRRQRQRISSREQPVAERSGVGFECRNEFPDGSEHFGMQIHQRCGNLLVQPR